MTRHGTGPADTHRSVHGPEISLNIALKRVISGLFFLQVNLQSGFSPMKFGPKLKWISRTEDFTIILWHGHHSPLCKVNCDYKYSLTLNIHHKFPTKGFNQPQTQPSLASINHGSKIFGKKTSRKLKRAKLEFVLWWQWFIQHLHFIKNYK